MPDLGELLGLLGQNVPADDREILRVLFGRMWQDIAPDVLHLTARGIQRLAREQPHQARRLAALARSVAKALEDELDAQHGKPGSKPGLGPARGRRRRGSRA